MNTPASIHRDSAQLAGLHLLRFFLTVSILIVHYPHFFFPYGEAAKPPLGALPFAPALLPIYSYGGFAVEIFWMISGVIFYIFYLSDIRDKQVSFPSFLGYRFSRLYPLHFATLLSVATLQWLYTNEHGTSFIYKNNDVTHFVLNALMINFWNAKFGLSFNGPFWSVSVEMFVYLVFFLFAFSGLLNRTKSIVAITVLFFGCYALGILSPFYECLLYFFAGTLLAQEFRWFNARKMLLLLVLVAAALIARFAFPVLQQHFEVKRIVDTLIKLPVSALIVVAFTKLFANPSPRAYALVMELGNLTYAVYMIHISIQLMLVQLLYSMGPSFFSTKTFFGSYLLASLVGGFFVHRYLEVPVQAYLRSFIKRRL